jgi:hypothetical protein
VRGTAGADLKYANHKSALQSCTLFIVLSKVLPDEANETVGDIRLTTSSSISHRQTAPEISQGIKMRVTSNPYRRPDFGSIGEPEACAFEPNAVISAQSGSWDSRL